MKVSAAVAAAIAVAAVAAVLLLSTRNTATAALNAAPAGAATRNATFSVGPGGTHALNDSFTVDVQLSDVVFSGSTTWRGYDVELHYDTSVLRAVAASKGLCVPAASTDWFVMTLTPAIVASCAFQDSTATTGVLTSVTFVCVGNGTSQLHLAADPQVGTGSDMYDAQVYQFAMTLNDNSAACDSALPTATATTVPEPTSTPAGSPTPTATPAGPPNTATLSIVAPSASQALNLPFLVTADLTSVIPRPGEFWAGYDFELAYDTTILQVGYVAPGLCPKTHWGGPYQTPRVVTGCYGLTSTDTGTLENIVVQCLRDGTSSLHIVPWADPTAFGSGTQLFNFRADPYVLTRVDATVTCNQHVDDDGDGCSNDREIALGLDPFNPWDFYGVSVPALVGASDPRLVLKSGMVGAVDAQAVFAYFKANAKTGSQVYDQDLDGNGVKDGIQYDRSIVGPARSGPPDGVVGAADAQLAFAQFKLRYRC